MKKNNRHQSAAAILPHGAAPERLSPLVHHLLDGVVRRSLEGDRAAIAEVARRLRGELLEAEMRQVPKSDQLGPQEK